MIKSAFVIIVALIVQWSLIQPGYEHDHHLLSSLSVASSSNSMEHLDVVITGVTAGLGKELTSVLLESGATVYALARSKGKLDKLGEEMKDRKGNMIPIVCDLQDLKSVSKAADVILESVGLEGKLDYLINNAGMHYGNPFKTKSIDIAANKSEGMDKLFVTNYLSHFLLTKKLLPTITNMVVQVSSSYHWQSDGDMLKVEPSNNTSAPSMPMAARGDFYDFNHRHTSYGNSKLAQVLHARALARRLAKEGSGVRVVSVCPSWAATDIAPEGPFRWFVQTFAFSPGQGIYSALMAMFRPEVKSGDFVGNTEIVPILGPYVSKNWSINGVPLRGFILDASAQVLMMLQRFNFGWYIVGTSPESKDVGLQEGLYKWSEKAVEKYVKAV